MTPTSTPTLGFHPSGLALGGNPLTLEGHHYALLGNREPNLDRLIDIRQFTVKRAWDHFIDCLGAKQPACRLEYGVYAPPIEGEITVDPMGFCTRLRLALDDRQCGYDLLVTISYDTYIAGAWHPLTLYKGCVWKEQCHRSHPSGCWFCDQLRRKEIIK